MWKKNKAKAQNSRVSRHQRHNTSGTQTAETQNSEYTKTVLFFDLTSIDTKDISYRVNFSPLISPRDCLYFIQLHGKTLFLIASKAFHGSSRESLALTFPFTSLSISLGYLLCWRMLLLTIHNTITFYTMTEDS
jgi:hypothetical protein